MRTTLLLLPLALAATTAAQDRPVEQRRTIAVTGHGEVKATPDRALLSFAVETTADRAAGAVAENAKRSGAVAAALKSALGADAAISTTHFAIEPRYAQPRPGETREPQITGYVVRNEVRVDRAPTDRVGALIDAATSAGANRIGNLQFTFSKQDELQRTALEQAGADARAQAESVARGLGVRLKSVLSATTGVRAVPVQRFEAMEMAKARSAPTPIEPGEGTIGATLHVTYEIE